MRKGEMLNNALVLMVNRHAGQFDKGGNPYSLHCLKVMHYLKSDDEELQCIALAHDLIEDTPTTFAELKEMGFTDRVIEGIRALTKMPGESYDDYKVRVICNPDAIKVKLCDLRHNTDVRRLKGVNQKDLDRMEKYHRFFIELSMINNA